MLSEGTQKQILELERNLRLEYLHYILLSTRYCHIYKYIYVCVYMYIVE